MKQKVLCGSHGSNRLSSQVVTHPGTMSSEYSIIWTLSCSSHDGQKHRDLFSIATFHQPFYSISLLLLALQTVPCKSFFSFFSSVSTQLSFNLGRLDIWETYHTGSMSKSSSVSRTLSSLLHLAPKAFLVKLITQANTLEKALPMVLSQKNWTIKLEIKEVDRFISSRIAGPGDLSTQTLKPAHTARARQRAALLVQSAAAAMQHLEQRSASELSTKWAAKNVIDFCRADFDFK